MDTYSHVCITSVTKSKLFNHNNHPPHPDTVVKSATDVERISFGKQQPKITIQIVDLYTCFSYRYSIHSHHTHTSDGSGSYGF